MIRYLSGNGGECENGAASVWRQRDSVRAGLSIIIRGGLLVAQRICHLAPRKYVPWIVKRSSSSWVDGSRPVSFPRSGTRVYAKQDMLVLLAKYATSAEDINTIVDRIHKNHRWVRISCCRQETSDHTSTTCVYCLWRCRIAKLGMVGILNLAWLLE